MVAQIISYRSVGVPSLRCLSWLALAPRVEFDLVEPTMVASLGVSYSLGQSACSGYCLEPDVSPSSTPSSPCLLVW